MQLNSYPIWNIMCCLWHLCLVCGPIYLRTIASETVPNTDCISAHSCLESNCPPIHSYISRMWCTIVRLINRDSVTCSELVFNFGCSFLAKPILHCCIFEYLDLRFLRPYPLLLRTIVKSEDQEICIAISHHSRTNAVVRHSLSCWRNYGK